MTCVGTAVAGEPGDQSVRDITRQHLRHLNMRLFVARNWRYRALWRETEGSILPRSDRGENERTRMRHCL